LRNKNNNIAIPLETNKKELQRLGSDLNTFQKQKQILDAQKQKLRRAEKELNEVEWDCEVLFQKLQALVKDRDGWKKKYNESVYTAQQRTNFQNLLLERKLSKLSMTGEKSTAAMAEILQKANIRLDTLDQSKVVITDVIREKNDQVEGLRQHLKSLKEAKTSMLAKHRRLVERYTSIATNNRDIKAKIRDKVSLIMAT
jgi:chromosome segregation ATPase